MSDNAPKIIAINHDDHHAEHIGRTDDGRQFFLTTPFVPATGGRMGSEFIALYVFTAHGDLVDAIIDNFGPRASVNTALRRETYDARLRELGAVSFERIEVKPFSVDRFDTTFGLVTRHPDEPDNPWAVEAQPGNYMAFFEPWDSGDYDT